MNNKNTYKKIKWYQRLLYIVPAVILFACSFSFLMPKSKDISASANSWIGGSSSGRAVVDLYAPDYISIKYDIITTDTELLITDFSGIGGPSLSATHPSDDSTLDLYSAPFTVGTRTFQRYFRVNPHTKSANGLVSSVSLSVPYYGSWQTRYTTTLRNPSANGDLTIVFHWDLLVGFVPYDNSIPLPSVTLFKTLTSVATGDFYRIGKDSGAGDGGSVVAPVVASCEGDLYNEYGFYTSLTPFHLSITSDYGLGSTLSLLPLFYDSDVAGSVRIYKDLTITLKLSLSTYGCFLLYDSIYTLPGFSYSTDSIYYLDRLNMFPLDGMPADINRDYVNWIVLSVRSFFEMELLPGFTIGGVLFTILAIFLAVVFLRLFAGG